MMKKFKCKEALEKRFPHVKFYGPASIGKNVVIGDGTGIGEWVKISDNCRIGRNCRILYHASLSKDVTLEDGVFVGPGARFSNDKYPPTKRSVGVYVEEEAIIGINTCVGAGVRVGRRAVVGMGAVAIKDVPAETVVIGNPARFLCSRAKYDEKQLEWIEGTI